MSTRSVRTAVPHLSPGESKVVESEGGPILLVRTDSGLRACSAVCPHQNRTLSGAIIRANTIICPWHGARFSLEDGSSASGITLRTLAIYPCSEEGSFAIVCLPQP